MKLKPSNISWVLHSEPEEDLIGFRRWWVPGTCNWFLHEPAIQFGWTRHPNLKLFGSVHLLAVASQYCLLISSLIFENLEPAASTSFSSLATR